MGAAHPGGTSGRQAVQGLVLWGDAGLDAKTSRNPLMVLKPRRGQSWVTTLDLYLTRWLSRWRICLKCRRPRFNPWVGKISWRRKWQPTPVFLARKSHGQRSLAGYSPWGRKELDMTEWLSTHTSDLHFHKWTGPPLGIQPKREPNGHLQSSLRTTTGIQGRKICLGSG